MKTNIALIGFMGTGKTAVGRLLAEKLRRRFIELDSVIEKKAGKSIPEIFVADGEIAFRELEIKATKEAARTKRTVIACGGGIVLDKENIRIMKETGTIICLSASTEVILKRTLGFIHRPLLNVKRPDEKIEILLKFRAPFYAQADYTIDTSNLSIEDVVKKIIKILKR